MERFLLSFILTFMVAFHSPVQMTAQANKSGKIEFEVKK